MSGLASRGPGLTTELAVDLYIFGDLIDCDLAWGKTGVAFAALC